MTPLILTNDRGQFNYQLHRPVWDSPTMEKMHCELCGMPILPEMEFRELFAPCSSGKVINGERPE
jgi:hypothetical protein